MITLDYTVRESPDPGRNLREADETALHYDLFLGDVIFRVDGADLSASWGWIPVIDFAVCLDRIVNEIVPRESQSLEFTESENRIDFTLCDGTVEIRTTYAAQQARVSLEEIRRTTREFLGRMLDDLMARYSTLAQNAYIRRIYPKVVISGTERT
jgi:hypothetical protein